MTAHRYLTHLIPQVEGVRRQTNTLQEFHSTTGKELSVLLPSGLDKPFKGELGGGNYGKN